jgi:hypothetical protein
MKKFKILIILPLLLFLFSCSTEVDINAPWKDITVVYGVLSQHDTIHYIKVNKAFLGDASAYEMAQQRDSLYYKNVIVTLEKVNVNNGNIERVFDFKDTIIDKKPGIFATDSNVVYYYKGKILEDNENPADYRYDLKVYIPDKDKNVTSSTYLLSDVEIKNPPYTDYANIPLPYPSPYKVMWMSEKGARLYQLKIVFHYYELTATDTTEHSIEMSFARKTSINADGGQELSSSFSLDDFLNFLVQNIPVDPNVTRVVKRKTFDFYVYTGSEDMYKYMQVSTPTNSLVQDRPFFTNINNGVGLFTSRSYTARMGKKMNRKFIDEISDNPKTRNLNFEDYEASTYFWANQ